MYVFIYQYVCSSMYVCMYAYGCMYLWMHVCMYCVYIFIDICTEFYVYFNKWRSDRELVCMYKCIMYVSCIYGWMLTPKKCFYPDIYQWIKYTLHQPPPALLSKDSLHRRDHTRVAYVRLHCTQGSGVLILQPNFCHIYTI